MIQFITEPLKIFHDKKIVVMTEEQVQQNMCLLEKNDQSGYRTKTDGYEIRTVLKVGSHCLPYAILLDILWQCIKAYHILHHFHSNNLEYKPMIARVYHVHQLLVPDAAGFVTPKGCNLSDKLAKSQGLTLLEEIIAMPDSERDALLEHDRQEGTKTFPNSAKITLKGEQMTVNELANWIRLGAMFLIFDAQTTTRGETRKANLMNDAIYGLIFSHLLTGQSEAKAINSTVMEVPGGNRRDIKAKADCMKLV